MEGFRLATGQRPLAFSGAPARSYLMVRAGMAGMGRFGAGVLTIEPNPVFVYNAAQARANLILSGVDYYSTDVSSIMEVFPLNPDNRVYESWLANLVLVNLPLVIPAELLSYPWAKLNLDLKASLEPYVYSLAYNSSQTGDPLVAPLLYYFQDDPMARDSAVETMVGPSLLVASGLTPNLETLEFYLPAGRWYDFINRDLVARETGGKVTLPAKSQGLHVAPMLLRSGTVIPMIADPSGPRRRQSILAFPGEATSSFVWYEDNGVDLGYRDGQFSTTVLELEPSDEDGRVRLTVRARQGSIPGEAASRQFWVEFVGLGNIGTAQLDGEMYKRSNNEEQLHAIEAGWFTNGDGRLVFKTPPLDLAEDHRIVLD
jgi:alpha-glucosidase